LLAYDPAMHQTNTVDYAVVYDSEIWRELDEAKPFISSAATSWCKMAHSTRGRNKGTKPVAMLFFLNGARARRT
jgi:hypothetical protein